jgi:NADPH:quinone reductase-like Zn-dependent oxidoreductase/acyl carrier protein
LRRGSGENQQLLSALGELYLGGAAIDWPAVFGAGESRRVELPTYPFQRRRYWLPAALARAKRGENAVGHPLIGTCSESALGHLQYDCDIRLESCPMLEQHRVAGAIVFPAAGYIELAIASARHRDPAIAVSLENCSFSAALTLSESRDCDVQFIVTPNSEGAAQFECFSRSGDSGGWVSHARGQIVDRRHAAEVEWTVSELAALCNEAVDIGRYRKKLLDVGLDYGPEFQALVAAWRGEGQALGILELPGNGISGAEYFVHPGLLDAAFHLIGLAIPDEDSGHFYIPVGFDRIDFIQSPGARARAFAHLGNVTPRNLTADVTVWTEAGELAVIVKGIKARALTRAEFQRSVGSSAVDLLIPEWRALGDPQAPVGHLGPWYLVGKESTETESLAADLRARGVDTHATTIDELLTEIREANLGEPAGIIDLRGMAGSPDDSASGQRVPIEALGLVRELAQRPPAKKLALVFVTRGAQRVDFDDLPSPFAAAIWGLAATASAELSSVDVRLLDCDPARPLGADALIEATIDRGEPRLAIRGGELRVQRLVRDSASQDSRLNYPPGRGYSLEMRDRGSLAGLALAAADVPQAGPGKVVIEVLASGLNFRDVLNLLDMYPGPAGPLGNECAGRVIEVGSGVESLAVGDLVHTIAESTFGSHVLADEKLTFAVPSRLSISQAAAFPIAQLTAYLALYRVGRIAAGDRVLIHAGAGGVGLAAVHLALAAGADVLATAGSDAKRSYLASLGVRQVFDSRSSLSADRLRDATDGHGIDLLLNSLTGDFIDDGIAALAPGGRFLEIGLREVREQSDISSVRDDIEYHPLLLGQVCKDDPDTVRAMHAELCRLLEAGTIPPPLIATFSLADSERAFRFMAKARHVGRIAIAHPALGHHAIRHDGAYVVTGGLGALGIHTAQWLVERGARHIVLIGRSEPSDGVRARLRELESRGAEIAVIAADVAEADAIANAIQGAVDVPVRGLVHAAGVVDDAPVVKLDEERFEAVMRPKAQGLISLYKAIDGTQLDFAVYFSSGSALLGSPGQAAYTAANAYLDAAAQRLAAGGAMALSIGWGAWAEGGMAARLDGQTLRDWAERGIGTLTTPAAIDALERSIASGRPQTAVLPIDWSRFARSGTGRRDIPIISALIPTVGTDEPDAGSAVDASFLKALEELPAPIRQAAIIDRLREETAAVMGIETAEVDPNVGLTEHGMDSLMAVELSGRIGRALELSLPSTFVFEYPTLSALSRHLLDQIAAMRRTESVEAAVPEQKESVEDAGVDDQDLESALRRELDQAGF